MLRYKSDLKSLAFIGGVFILRTLTWFIVSPSFWWLIFPYAWLTFCVLTIKHNHAHHKIFDKRWQNKILDLIFSALTGTSAAGIVIIHLINHHQELNSDNDWGNTRILKYRWEVLNLITYPIVFIHRYLLGQKKMFKDKKYSRLKGYELREKLQLLSFYLILLIIDPIQTLLYVVLINFLAQLILVVFNYIQHNGCDENSTYNHSINFTGNVLNWFVFNTGFHTIHHQYPQLHWSLLPARHQELIVPYIDPGLNHPDFLRSFWKHYILPGNKIGLQSITTQTSPSLS